MYTTLLILCIIAPSALLLAAHWFPWPAVFGAELPRLVAYTIGAVVIVGVPTAACVLGWWFGLERPAVAWAALYVVSLVSGGGATTVAYLVDAGRHLRRQPMGLEEVNRHAGSGRQH